MHKIFIALIAVSMLAGCKSQPVKEAQNDPQQQQPQPTEKPLYGAERFFCEIGRILDDVEQNLPAIADSASEAADLYMNNNDLGIASDGEPAFMWEGVWRSGCLMAQDCCLPNGGKDWKGIMLYCLRADALDQDIKKITGYQNYGIKIWLFATQQQAQQIKDAGITADSTIIIPAAEHNGLLKSTGGRYLVNTHEIASFTVLMPWIGEFAAACTRNGKMPPMFESIRKPNGQARIDKFKTVRWHDADMTPPPVSRCVIGRKWIKATRKRLADLHDTQMAKIKQAAQISAEALLNGHALYVVSAGHGSTVVPNGLACDPGYFTNINNAWQNQNKFPEKYGSLVNIRSGDVLLGIGYDEFFGGDRWFNLADHARKAGATCIWSLAAYRDEQMSQVKDGDLFIDPQWQFGDADVEFPGYDVKVLPTSGVLSTSVYLMINAEIHHQLRKHFERQGILPEDSPQPETGAEQ